MSWARPSALRIIVQPNRSIVWATILAGIASAVHLSTTAVSCRAISLSRARAACSNVGLGMVAAFREDHIDPCRSLSSALGRHKDYCIKLALGNYSACYLITKRRRMSAAAP
jgi:hypothetical protein